MSKSSRMADVLIAAKGITLGNEVHRYAAYEAAGIMLWTEEDDIHAASVAALDRTFERRNKNHQRRIDAQEAQNG